MRRLRLERSYGSDSLAGSPWTTRAEPARAVRPGTGSARPTGLRLLERRGPGGSGGSGADVGSGRQRRERWRDWPRAHPTPGATRRAVEAAESGRRSAVRGGQSPGGTEATPDGGELAAESRRFAGATALSSARSSLRRAAARNPSPEPGRRLARPLGGALLDTRGAGLLNQGSAAVTSCQRSVESPAAAETVTRPGEPERDRSACSIWIRQQPPAAPAAEPQPYPSQPT